MIMTKSLPDPRTLLSEHDNPPGHGTTQLAHPERTPPKPHCWRSGTSDVTTAGLAQLGLGSVAVALALDLIALTAAQPRARARPRAAPADRAAADCLTGEHPDPDHADCDEGYRST